jgi:hypothetical protein
MMMMHELIEDDDELYLNIHVRGYLTISIAGQKFQPPQNLPYIHAIMPTSSTLLENRNVGLSHIG